MNKELIEKCHLNNQHYLQLYCKNKKINEYITYYYDEKLKDMYDHNFFASSKEITEADLKKMFEIKHDSKANHLKVVSSEESQILKQHNFQSGKLLLMLYSDDKLEMKNEEIEIKHFSQVDLTQQLLDLELIHYGKNYGEDFVNRKMQHYINKCLTDDRFDFVAALLNGKVVGYCCVFVDDSICFIDDLLVHRDYRNQAIGTTLLAYIRKHYDYPLALQADDDDTPKYMYEKMGFVTIDYEYEYLLLDNE